MAGEEGGVTLVLHPGAAASIDSWSAAQRYAPERIEKLEGGERFKKFNWIHGEQYYIPFEKFYFTSSMHGGSRTKAILRI
uniref:Uncharacterized protein n=1 Tax=Oryza meridionalis TaxID=40149 RepID=A0A0E0D1H3_9ORYZ